MNRLGSFVLAVITATAATVAVTLWAGGRKGALPRPERLHPAQGSPPAPVLADETAGARAAPPSAGIPQWVQERPHFFKRDGRSFAAAVGRARAANLPLARSAAQGRARAALLRLLQGKTPAEDARGEVRGARVTGVYFSENGRVFVRMELETGD